MFNAFIFDLDNTLINTSSLHQFRGAANVSQNSRQYQQSLLSACKGISNPYLISFSFIEELKATNPSAKFCVITRSPRFYAEIVLSNFYQNFKWDSVVAYEDVQNTKPDPEGVIKALTDAGVDGEALTDTFVIIGDEDSDILCGYRAGLSTILYSAGWPSPPQNVHYRATQLLPDASVKLERTLKEAIEDLPSRLPILEARIAGREPTTIRAPKFARFCPLEEEKTQAIPHPRVNVIMMGRMFSNYDSLEYRRDGHALTEQIHANKDSSIFPDEWVRALKSVIDKQLAESTHYMSCVLGQTEICITCIPHKPGRKPRLENLIFQLENEYSTRTGSNFKRKFKVDLLQYGSGARSHHGEKLKRDARFENVRDNLAVPNPDAVVGKIVFIVDDVVTSGASLYFAEKYLLQAGAKEVVCIALAQAIGDSA